MLIGVRTPRRHTNSFLSTKRYEHAQYFDWKPVLNALAGSKFKVVTGYRGAIALLIFR